MALAWKVQERVVLYAPKFASLTLSPTGDIHVFARELARDARMIAYVRAPSRTGEMRRKIQSRVPRGGTTFVSAMVECTAWQGVYVHEGTDGYSSGMTPMTLYAGAHPHFTRAKDAGRSPSSWVGKAPTAGRIGNFQKSVGSKVYYRRGQKANPFLSDAGRIARRRAGV